LIAAPDALKMTIRRANLYRAAGADCLFTPGPVDSEIVRILAREIDGPINIVMGLGTAQGNARGIIAAGARRISLGGSIARTALGLVRRAGVARAGDRHVRERADRSKRTQHDFKAREARA